MAARSTASPLTVTQGLRQLVRYSDVALACGLTLVVGMLVIPLPEALLDVLIILNFTLALSMLLVAAYVQEPLEFSVFPSLLLFATLFRLALNVSSSRLILLQAHAGEVISAFGSFVVGGNYVVGFVIFLILVIIQFVVITNGAGRVAEVAARFTLDGMPGKQMAIDADLNAGLISEEEARQRRRLVEQEADFYGAMDGASKFVKGDAIAGIVIIIVNILGGLAVGVLQHGMALDAALETYALLTIGDGLVSQIPALLISTATGLIVTRTASEAPFGQDVVRQLLSQPRTLAIVAGLVAVLGLAPGLPKAPFFVLAAVLGGFAYVIKNGKQEPGEQPPPATAATNTQENLKALLRVDPIELEIGYGLVSLADAERGGTLLSRVAAIRRQLAGELGIILPTIRIRDNLQLQPNAYCVRLRGVEVARGEVRQSYFLA
ncbi:MAG TPA: flagellar biosynthesis protein FlhA, partial [Chloroflexota bacterium]